MEWRYDFVEFVAKSKPSRSLREKSEAKSAPREIDEAKQEHRAAAAAAQCMFAYVDDQNVLFVFLQKFRTSAEATP